MEIPLSFQLGKTYRTPLPTTQATHLTTSGGALLRPLPIELLTPVKAKDLSGHQFLAATA